MADVLYLFLLTATITVVCSQKPPFSYYQNPPDSQTILLGGLFPLSENINGACGHVSTSAVAAVEAMRFAIGKINANSTLLPNITLAYDIRDTCSIPNQALEQSLSYVHNPSMQEGTGGIAVSGIVGAGFYSEVSRAVASLFRLFQIPQISYGSSASLLSDRVQYDFFFRTLPSDSYLSRAMADAVAHFKWSYIIALHSDDIFGTSGMEVILKNIRSKGNRTCIAVKISIPAGNESDGLFDKVVAQMNAPWVNNASVALLYGYKRQTLGIMKAIERLLVHNPDTPLKYLNWVGCEALRIDSKYHYLLHGMIRMEITVKGSQEFQEHFTSLTESNAINRSLFREYLEHAQNCSFSRDTCGDRSRPEYQQKNEISSIIDAVYAFAYAIHGLIQTHCNNSVLCSEIMVSHLTGTAVNGSMIRDYLLKNLSFPGLTSDSVSFDENGNDKSYYTVKNLQAQSDGTYEYISVGTWTTDTHLAITERVEWHGRKKPFPKSICSQQCKNGFYRVQVSGQSECCWTCTECPGENTVSIGEACSKCDLGYSPNANRSDCIKNQVTYLNWSHPWAIVILFCTCVGMITTMSIMVIYIVFYNNTIVKASSRELSAILLVGLLLCYILPFFFIGKPSPVICAIRRFAVGFSFAICFSPLLVKTNRLHRIFNRAPDKIQTVPKFINPASQVIITFILLSIQVIIAILWLVIQHPDIVYASKGSITELRCNESSNIGLIVSLGYNLLLLILSTYFAFLARKIPENFNEARYINVTLYTIIIIWIAFIPTYFATNHLSTTYHTSSLIIAIVLSATTTLGCLFMPKIYLIIKKKVKEKESKAVTSTNGVTVKSNVLTTKSSSDFSTAVSTN